MANKDRKEIDVDKSKETRSKEISRMISEGGLGAHSHYYYNDISKDEHKSWPKQETRSKEVSRMIAEGGLGSHSHFYYNDDLKDDKKKK